MDACLEAGLAISGINGEVMPAQWEFQIGPIGAPTVGDHLWLARWLLYRIGEDVETVDGRKWHQRHAGPQAGQGRLERAPGRTTNFSTNRMREDYDACVAAAEALKGPATTCTSPTTGTGSRSG